MSYFSFTLNQETIDVLVGMVGEYFFLIKLDIDFVMCKLKIYNL